MSLRKKLQLSNLFMLGMSIVIVVTAGFFGIRLLGSRYLDSLEDLVVKDRGLYSAQTLIFSYQESFGTDPAQAVQELEKELSLMNFGFLVRADEEEWFSNLSEAQEETMESLLPGDTKDYGALAFIRDQTTLVQEKFMKNGISWEITACRFPGSKGSVPYVSYLKKYLSTLILLVGVITLSAVFLTNLALTHWVSKSILGPLKKLRKGQAGLQTEI